MNLSFTCPHCGTTTNISERYAGLSGPCAHCGQRVTMPSLEAFHATIMRWPETPAALQPTAVPPRRPRWVRAALWASGITAALLILMLAVVVVRRAPDFIVQRVTPQHRDCEGNMLRIAHALQAYSAQYNALPPAVTFDAQGRPAHSWRVLLLPFLGEDELHGQYDFDQPWDGPTNRPLHARMPAVYGCPADPDFFLGQTNYFAVTGPGTAWPPTGEFRPFHISSADERRIIVVEHVGTSVTWLEPRDLPWDQLAGDVNDYDQTGVTAWHADGAHVVLVDGDVEFLDSGTPAAEVRQRLQFTSSAAAYAGGAAVAASNPAPAAGNSPPDASATSPAESSAP